VKSRGRRIIGRRRNAGPAVYEGLGRLGSRRHRFRAEFLLARQENLIGVRFSHHGGPTREPIDPVVISASVLWKNGLRHREEELEAETRSRLDFRPAAW